MLTKEIAAIRIARELQDAERSVDQALSKIATLASSMATARAETGLRPAAGQSAFMRLGQTQRSLISASIGLTRVHGDLLKVNEEVRAMSDEDGACPGQTTGVLYTNQLAA